jgi:hypothetical protein
MPSGQVILQRRQSQVRYQAVVDAQRAGHFTAPAGRAAIISFGHLVQVLVGQREAAEHSGFEKSALREVTAIHSQ